MTFEEKLELEKMTLESKKIDFIEFLTNKIKDNYESLKPMERLEIVNKMYFYYVVGVGDEVFCFDILELVEDNHNFLWEWKKMPITTEFGNKQMIYKYVGYIPLNKAFIRYKR